MQSSFNISQQRGKRNREKTSTTGGPTRKRIPKFETPQVGPKYNGPTQFDPWLESDKSLIHCNSLNSKSIQGAYLMQRCPCEYIWNGSSFVPTATLQDKVKDYTFTRFGAPNPLNKTQSIGCIPKEYASSVILNPSLSLGETKIFLERNSLLNEKLPRFIELVQQSIHFREQFLELNKKRIENIPLEEGPNELVAMTSKYVNRAIQLGQAIQFAQVSLDEYLQQAQKQLKLYNLEDNPVMKHVFGYSSDNYEPVLLHPDNLIEVKRIQNNLRQTKGKNLTLEEVKQYMEDENSKIKEKENELLSTAPFSIRNKKKLTDAKKMISKSLDSVQKIIEHQLKTIDELQQSLIQFISNEQKELKGQVNQIIMASEHEFKLVNRFGVSSETAIEITGETYPNPTTIPVDELTSVTGYDVPATNQFWDRYVLEQYTKDKHKNLDAFMESGKLLSPNRIQIPKVQFLNMIRSGLETNELTKSDLALAELAHDLTYQTQSIRVEQLDLLPPDIQQMVQHFLQHYNKLQSLTLQQQRLLETIQFLKTHSLSEESASIDDLSRQLHKLEAEIKPLSEVDWNQPITEIKNAISSFLLSRKWFSQEEKVIT